MASNEALQEAAWALMAADLVRLTRRHALLAYALGARQAGLDLELADLLDPRGQEFVARFSYESIKSLRRWGSEQTRLVLLQAIREGRGAEWAAERLDEVLLGRIGTVEVIARTETNRAANWGRLNGWKRSGIVRDKEFIATLDDRVADDHLEAHGEVVPLDAPFTRGAADGFQAPPLRPNCRCTVAPITRYSPVGRTGDQVDEDVAARDALLEERADEEDEATAGLRRRHQAASIDGILAAEADAERALRDAWRRGVARLLELLRHDLAAIPRRAPGPGLPPLPA